MKLLKFGFRLTGIIVTAAVLFSAANIISRSADENFERTGAYHSDLLVWEQDHPGEGQLFVLGYPVRVDLERLQSLRERFNEFAGKFTFRLLNGSESDLEPSETTEFSDRP